MCHVKRYGKRLHTLTKVIYWFHMEQIPGNKLENKLVGRTGEDIAAKFLKSRGFQILGINYLKKWGEIDIIAKKDSKICFVEVKTVSYETKLDLESSVSRGTWRPEDNVHAHKIKKLSRAIESWLQEFRYEGEWQIDVMAVKVVPREKYATVKYIENIIL